MKKDIFSQINAPRRSQLIESQIKDAILSQHYQVGDRLPSERELADLFGSSRSIVREALRSVEKSGLLTIKTGAQGGAFVTEISPNTVSETFSDMILTRQVSHEEILRVRLYLEPQAAAEAAQRVTEENLLRLKECERALEEGFNSGDVYLEHNPHPNLHKVISEITGNRLLALLMDVLMEITTKRFSHIEMDSDTKSLVANDHRKILKAIELKDPQLAAKAMEQHVMNVYQTQKELEDKGKIGSDKKEEQKR